MSITWPPYTLNKGFTPRTFNKSTLSQGGTIEQILPVGEGDRAVDCVKFEAKGMSGKDEPATVRNPQMKRAPSGCGGESGSVGHGRAGRRAPRSSSQIDRRSARPLEEHRVTSEASSEVVPVVSNPEDIMRTSSSAAIVVSIAMASMMWVSAPVQADPPPGVYTVEEGNKVDDRTLAGWKTWRAMACERCHGAEQEGLVGPSLVNSLKTLSKEDFHTTITNGRPEKGMPNFGGVPLVQKNWENLYNYLKGRSEGRIAPGHLYPMSQADAPAAPAGWNKPN